MRTLAAAVVVGLALGAAALGPFTPIEGPQRTNADEPVIDDDMPVASFDAHVAVTAGHGDSNTSGETVYLNQNVIDGVSTTICTRDTALKPLVDEAVLAWNNALDDLTFNPFRQVTTTDCSGAEIEVVQNSLVACPKAFNASSTMGAGTRACYSYISRDYPPRKKFSNTQGVSSLAGRALVIYQALSHEPGSN